MRRFLPLLILLLFLGGTDSLSREFPDVRVKLFANRTSTVFYLNSATLKVAGDQVAVSSSRGKLRGTKIRASNIYPTPDRWWLGPDKKSWRTYRGEIEFSIKNGNLLAINRLPLEEYLLSVVPSEMPPEWPGEALKAQAIAARTYALRNLGRHQNEGFDLCDLTHCQVYRGAQDERESTSAAVKATREEVLTYDGRPIDALYHSTCGGATANNDDVFESKPLPYLRSVVDSAGKEYFCRASPHFGPWYATYTAEEFLGALQADPATSPGKVLTNLEVVEKDTTGRSRRVKISGEEEKVVTGYRFWLVMGKTAGWAGVKGTYFNMEKQGKYFSFAGRGAGHGVGMCQWGAKGMAERRYNYKDILAHYYLGSVLGTP